ncbi:MAG: tRNA dihydrouridine synthase DusB [Desulfotignum sp.]|nr:tRNA dihydrouridine synthase DusB [Desulfotignum sp.]
MKIGSIDIPGKTFLAPLAGITNLPFRTLVKECGCAVVCSEMISAKGLFYNSDKTLALLRSCPEERPLSVQIFGADPAIMARAAAEIEVMGVADILDINFGCSVKKVVKQGAGAALMQDMENSRRILQAVRNATTLALTIKIRSGWTPCGSQAFALAETAQHEGVDAVIFHPRTATQGFKGRADRTLIRQLKTKISIPVIGNGDIHTAADALDMLDQTGCDGVMIGRAAMTNPFILSQVESLITHGTCRPIPYTFIFNKMERLIHLYIKHFGEQTACRMLKGKLPWFVKGLPGCSDFRKNLSQIPSTAHALELIHNYEFRLNL